MGEKKTVAQSQYPGSQQPTNCELKFTVSKEKSAMIPEGEKGVWKTLICYAMKAHATKNLSSPAMILQTGSL